MTVARVHKHRLLAPARGHRECEHPLTLGAIDLVRQRMQTAKAESRDPALEMLQGHRRGGSIQEVMRNCQR